jgi:hypothetical protein
MGRLADGWFPMIQPGGALDHAIGTVRAAAEASGRDPERIGMEGRVTWNPQDPDDFARQVEQWRLAEATHLSVNTMNIGHRSVDDHIYALASAAALCLAG